MSSGFISEAELAEQRRIRQEAWDKVRKPDQPEECPEEEYDHRSLFERLEEQKQKRELEYEEAHKLKNMIKGLDDDEVEFLDLVDRSKLEEERRKSAEEAREIKDFRDAVAILQEQSLEQRIHTEIHSRPPIQSGTGSGRSSQVRLLAGAVVRKQPGDASTQAATNKKFCGENKDGVAVSQDVNSTQIQVTPTQISGTSEDGESASKKRKNRDEEIQNGDSTAVGLRCIGILPGLGLYPDSSDSEQSSDTDQELPCPSGYDLLGRKITQQTKEKSTTSSSSDVE
ncbi:protein FAM192A isoform X2 [Zootermopsis nevadensis]|uniref:protein FAM192A isoform X2 n=1 Tax=Zootermopsis nevadensis TaxID=136037 RepID=UPI000B8E426F|nr:protein FAM192A isoform X2 [Zootermopsis nevadensis]